MRKVTSYEQGPKPIVTVISVGPKPKSKYWAGAD